MKRMTYSVAVSLWVVILFLTGSYIRIGADEAVPVLDWLIIAEVLACSLGGLVGVVLLRTSKNKLNYGEKALLAFSVIAFLSAFFSRYPRIVLGYSVLLLGTSLLTMGILRRINTQAQLNKLENIWLITITLILVKDALISMLLPGMQDSYTATGPSRLGLGVTTPAVMSLLATLCFWISLKNDEGWGRAPLWILRGFYIAVIVLAKTRVSMVCFFVAGFVRIWFYLRSSSLILRIGFVSLFVCSVSLLTLILVNRPELSTTIFSVANRAEESGTLATFTGRTEIWPSALKKAVQDGLAFLSFGHGYGVSRLIINEGSATPSFYAKHAHNTFLEILLTMGLLGITAFAIMLIYSMKWLKDFDSLRQTFSDQFLLRAVSVVAITLVYSLTESYLGVKIGPIAISYIIYLLALDRRHFLKA